MPVPKRKTSKKRRNQRSAGKHVVFTSSSNCQNCSAPVMQHSVCRGCGYYRGIKVLTTKEERAQERSVRKQMRERSLEEAAAAKRTAATKKAAKDAKAIEAEVVSEKKEAKKTSKK